MKPIWHGDSSWSELFISGLLYEVCGLIARALQPSKYFLRFPYIHRTLPHVWVCFGVVSNSVLLPTARQRLRIGRGAVCTEVGHE